MRSPVPLAIPFYRGPGFLKVLASRPIICRMADKPEPPHLFWLTYRHCDGRTAGVVVIKSHGILRARLIAPLSGADRELEFASELP
jgi:hypothetical protein